RCAQTSFKVDHFRARCRFDGVGENLEKTKNSQVIDLTEEKVNIDPKQELYGSLLFKKGVLNVSVPIILWRLPNV
ncbi:hypothetical protein QUF54_11335, partial [Candidatus Marithioploca araucensis]|nr:hypothetical protein [Candidatus Marithioploca araucensis]